jgi:DNA helicase-2/ATP-dependent DNA helicase PcrA
MTSLSPVVIAGLLGLPSPTDEQQHVITAPLAPGVVVAGAGSGKTETMAARVVWLVANGHVQPDQVLGLTFTRKAASELGQRVRRRLTALQATGRVVVPAGEPTVSTYDAFAGRLVNEHGARLGVEPGRRLLTPAGAWQRAARLVRRWDGPMDDVVSAPDTVVADLLDLHEQAASHLVGLDAVETETTRLLALVDSLPPGPRQRKALHSRLEPVRRAQVTRLRVLPLLAAYRADLESDDLADFATIASEAATIARSFDEVGLSLRSQFRLVLLDEFQDTSYAQLELLLALFGVGHAVTAVGDPFQSIYAWRGANADTLSSFAERFGAGTDVPRYSLRTSFRNSDLVLAVANSVAEPLRAGGHQVDPLEPAPRAGAGSVRVWLHRTKAQQAQVVAEQVQRLWQRPGSGRRDETGGAAVDPPTIGVLVRKRDEMPLLESALRERGIPVEVVGLDGLLTVPEVADAVAMLQVAVDPSRGDAAVRLLTGPAMRFGPRDLDGLARWARRLSPDPAPDQPSWQAPRTGVAECLGSPPPRGWLSAPAQSRLRRLSVAVAHVRQRLSRPLPDVVAEAAYALGVDVETLARAYRVGGAGTAHLDRLVDEAAQFAQVAPQAGVPEFLDYLAAAEQTERGLRRAADVHLGSAVQLLTVHAAKGLEWDVVVLAGLTESGFPARSRTGAAWLTDAGTLPYRLRGDARHLPQVDTAGVGDQSDLAARVGAFVDDSREVDLDEERRLAYVALTRARHTLHCHGYRWGAGQRPLDPSRFLVQLAACPGVAVETWTDDPGDPPDAVVGAPAWPSDPLGRHRPALESGAALVRAAMAVDPDEPVDAEAGPPPASAALSGRAAEWSHEAEMLLAERVQERDRTRRVRMPAHLSATQLVAASRDPEQFLNRLRRPMPVRPRVEARQGTAFHAWLEQRFGNPRLLDLDELPGAADAFDPPAEADLAELQSAFLASEWADRTPLEVEAPFEMVVAGTVVRGRADAVFPDADGLLVVDWKTGPPPTSPGEVAARSAQLAVYRQAFATLHGLPLHKVRAVFHHVRENVTVAQSDAPDSLVTDVVGAVTAAAAGSRPGSP